MALAHGTPIGPYSVVRLIGPGGLGEVSPCNPDT